MAVHPPADADVNHRFGGVSQSFDMSRRAGHLNGIA